MQTLLTLQNMREIGTPLPPLRLYSHVPVSLSMQACGSKFAVIMRGKEEDIESTFNGFFNFNATRSREVTYHDGLRMVGSFWAFEESFVYGLAHLRLNHLIAKGFKSKRKGNIIWKRACESALYFMECLRLHSEPNFFTFEIGNPKPFALGSSISAEKPDWSGVEESFMSGASRDEEIKTELDPEQAND